MSGCGVLAYRVSSVYRGAGDPACAVSPSGLIAHGRHLAGFIHACYTRQPQLAAKLMKDVIAETVVV